MTAFGHTSRINNVFANFFHIHDDAIDEKNQMSVYAGSCKSSRRAKRLRSESGSTSASVGLPKLRPREQEVVGAGGTLTAAATSSSAFDPIPAPTAVVRKPTSRAAREAQRKLNHSIIEKVRRTKINDALAMLRAIVPVDYGEGEEAAPRGGGGGRKEEKEKEFKLEILVRTVAFVQDLVERVGVLERDTLCERCGGKRKRACDGGEDDVGDEGGGDTRTSVSSSKHTARRLPSISSWLPLQHQHQRHHLPSPPSSTLVDPINPTQLPPLFTLDPPGSRVRCRDDKIPARSRSSPPTPTNAVRTPEDESVASLLLQIRNSPPTVYTVSTVGSSPRGGTGVASAETPGSLLGLDLGYVRKH